MPCRVYVRIFTVLMACGPRSSPAGSVGDCTVLTRSPEQYVHTLSSHRSARGTKHFSHCDSWTWKIDEY